MRNKMLGTGEKGYHPMRKVRVIVSGLRYAFADFSVLYKTVLSLVMLVPVILYNGWIDASVVLLATGAMIAAEMFNTAIEAVCDYMQSDFDKKIGMIKDVAAAATAVVIGAWMLVMAIELYELWEKLSA
jgi:diacylglycerol kinase (ATP)